MALRVKRLDELTNQPQLRVSAPQPQRTLRVVSNGNRLSASSPQGRINALRSEVPRGQSFFDRLKSTFDANTAQDRLTRLERGEREVHRLNALGQAAEFSNRVRTSVDALTGHLDRQGLDQIKRLNSGQITLDQFREENDKLGQVSDFAGTDTGIGSRLGTAFGTAVGATTELLPLGALATIPAKGVASIGLKSLGKQPLKKSVKIVGDKTTKQLAKEGAKFGAAEGGAQGLATSLSGDNRSIRRTAESIGLGAALGGGLGGAAGGVAGAASSALKVRAKNRALSNIVNEAGQVEESAIRQYFPDLNEDQIQTGIETLKRSPETAENTIANLTKQNEVMNAKIVGEAADTVFHVPGTGLFARVTKDQYKVLSNEVQNIPVGQGDVPHLSPLKSALGAGLEEVPIEQIASLTDNAKTAAENAGVTIRGEQPLRIAPTQVDEVPQALDDVTVRAEEGAPVASEGTVQVTDPNLTTPARAADVPQGTQQVGPSDVFTDVAQQAELARAPKGRTGISKILARIKETLFDPLSELTKLDRIMEAQLGRKLTAEESVAAMADNVRAFTGDAGREQAISILEKEGIMDLFRAMGPDNMRQFRQYQNLMFGLEALQKAGKQVIRKADGTPYNVQELGNAIRAYEAANPSAKAFNRKFKEFSDKIVDFAVEGGLLDKEAAEYVKNTYKNYAPLERVFAEDLARPKIGMSPIGSISRQKVIQQLEGSDLALDDSADIYLKKTHDTLRDVARAQLGRKVAELGQRGDVPGVNTILTKETSKRLNQIREILPELRSMRDSLRSTGKRLSKTVRIVNRELSATQERALKFVKNKLELDETSPVKKEVDRINREISKTSNKKKINDTKLGIHTKALANSVRKDLRSKVDDDAYAAIADLSDNELIEIAGTEIYMGGKGITDLSRVLKLERESAGAESALDSMKDLLSKTRDDPDSLAAIDSLTKEDAIEIIDSIESGKRISDKLKNLSGYKGSLEEDIFNLRSMAEGTDAAIGDLIGESVSIRPDPTTGKQILTTLDEGVPVKVEITPELANVLQGLDTKDLDVATKFFAAMTRPYRSAYTGMLNPLFSGVSFTSLDPLMSFIVSPIGLRTILSPEAWKVSTTINKAGKDFRAALLSSGAQLQTGSYIPKTSGTSLEYLAGSGLDKVNQVLKNPREIKGLLNKLDVIGGALSNSTRQRIAKAHFDYAISKGLSRETAMAEAVWAFNNIMPNYSRTGTLLRTIDAYIPYTAASVAGTRSFAQAVARDPVKTLGKTAVVLTPAVAAVYHNLSQPKGQEYYEDLIESGNRFTLENNINIVTPWAQKDPKTGKWTGVFKIPIAPELRALNGAATRGVLAAHNEEGQDAMDISKALFDTATGQVFNDPSNPFVNTVAGVTTNQNLAFGGDVIPEDMRNLPPEQQVYSSTSENAKQIGGLLGMSPIQVDFVLDQFGGFGRLISGDTDALGEVERKFSGATGLSEGRSHFKDLEDVSKGITDQDTLKSFEALHSGSLDAGSRSKLLLESPSTLKAEQEYQKKRKARGTATDPIWDLPADRLKTFLGYQFANSEPGNKTADNIVDNNPWIKDVFKKRSEFFGQISDKAPEAQVVGGVTKPQVSTGLGSKLEQMGNITDPSQRVEFMANNPDIGEYFDKSSAFERAKREQLGLPQFDEYPEPNAKQTQLQNAYNTLPDGTGAKSKFLKANPELLALWAARSVWTLQEEGAEGRFENTEFSQKGIKSVAKLAANLIKMPDGSYMFDPNTYNRIAEAGGSGGGFGGSGGGRGSSKKSPKVRISAEAFARPSVKLGKPKTVTGKSIIAAGKKVKVKSRKPSAGGKITIKEIK